MQTENQAQAVDVELAETMSTGEYANIERRRQRQINITLIVIFAVIVAFTVVGLINMLTHEPAVDQSGNQKGSIAAPSIQYAYQPASPSFTYVVR